MHGIRPKPKIKREPRRRRHVSAWIGVPGETTNTECRLLDVSQRGGKIVTDVEAEVGSLLNITLVPRTPKRQCEVVWRRGKTLGIKFLP
jgi:PilZ domain